MHEADYLLLKRYGNDAMIIMMLIIIIKIIHASLSVLLT